MPQVLDTELQDLTFAPHGFGLSLVQSFLAIHGLVFLFVCLVGFFFFFFWFLIERQCVLMFYFSFCLFKILIENNLYSRMSLKVSLLLLPFPPSFAFVLCVKNGIFYSLSLHSEELTSFVFLQGSTVKSLQGKARAKKWECLGKGAGWGEGIGNFQNSIQNVTKETI
jgi:hypothetical protein